MLQFSLGLCLLGLVGGVDVGVEFRHLCRAELHVAEQGILDGRLCVARGAGQVAVGVIQLGEGMEGCVLLGGVPYVGNGRQQVVLAGLRGVARAGVEAAQFVGHLGILGGILSYLFEQAEQQRLGLFGAALRDELAAAAGLVTVGTRGENPQQRVVVAVAQTSVFVLVADDGIVLEVARKGLIVERQEGG